MLKIIKLQTFVSAVNKSRPKSSAQAIWALGNIAGDGSELRTLLLKENIHKFLFHFAKENHRKLIQRPLSFFFMNISREQASLMYEDFEIIVAALKILLYSEDSETKGQCLFALGIICLDNPKRIQGILNLNILPVVLEYTRDLSITIHDPALKLIGNISIGDNGHVDCLFKANVLDYIDLAFENSSFKVKKEAVYIISNIIGTDLYCLQKVLDHPVILKVIDLLTINDLSVLKELSYVFYNIGFVGNIAQFKILIEKSVFYKMKYALNTLDATILKNFLHFIKTVLKFLEINKMDDYREVFLQSGCLEVIEGLQKHMNACVYELIVDIIKHFEHDEVIEIEDTPMNFDF